MDLQRIGPSPHSGLGSGRVALPAEHVAVQGEAAIVVRLNGQRFPTVLRGGNRKNTLVEKAPVHHTHPHFCMRKAKRFSSNGPELSSLPGFPPSPPPLTAPPVQSPSLLLPTFTLIPEASRSRMGCGWSCFQSVHSNKVHGTWGLAHLSQLHSGSSFFLV